MHRACNNQDDDCDGVSIMLMNRSGFTVMGMVMGCGDTSISKYPEGMIYWLVILHPMTDFSFSLGFQFKR